MTISQCRIGRLRDEELYRLMMAVEHDEKRVVLDGLAAFIHVADGFAVEHQAEAAHPAQAPFFVGHLLAIGPQPDDVFFFGAANRPVLIKLAAVQVGMIAAHLDQLLREFQQRDLAASRDQSNQVISLSWQ